MAVRSSARLRTMAATGLATVSALVTLGVTPAGATIPGGTVSQMSYTYWSAPAGQPRTVVGVYTDGPCVTNIWGVQTPYETVTVITCGNDL